MDKQAIFETKGQSTTLSSLTNEQLRDLFSSIERTNEPTKKAESPSPVSAVLSPFGLQSANDVMRFIKTHKGQSVLTMINNELARIEALKESQNRDNLAEALRLQQRLLFILMALVQSREADAKRLNETIQEQLDRQLAAAKKSSETTKLPEEMVKEMLKNAIAQYDFAIKAIDDKLNEITQQINSLLAANAKLNVQGQRLAARHAYVKGQLTQTNNLLQSLYNAQGTPNQLDPIMAAHCNEQISTITPQIAVLNNRLAKTQNSDAEPTPAQVVDNLELKLLKKDRKFYDRKRSASSTQNIEHIVEELLTHSESKLNLCWVSKQELENIVDQETIELVEQKVEALQYIIEGLKSTQLNGVNGFQVIIVASEGAYHQKRERIEQQKQQNITRLEQHKEEKIELIKTRETVVTQRDNAVKLLSDPQAIKQLASRGSLTLPEALSMVPRAGQTRTIKNRPEASPASSYSQIMSALQTLVPSGAPVPPREEFRRSKDAFYKETELGPRSRYELETLFGQVEPGKVMHPQARNAWFDRVEKVLRSSDDEQEKRRPGNQWSSK